jgi:hypothetical protein
MAMTVRRLSLTSSGPASSAECAVTAHGIAPEWAVTAHSAGARGGDLLRYRQRVGEAEPGIEIIAVEAGHGLNAIG